MPLRWLDDGPPVLAPGALVLTSFPSAGLAATVAAHYIVRSLDLPRIGVFDDPDGPGIAIVQSGQVQPPLRVHGRSDLAVFLSELPVPTGTGGEIARTILDGAEKRSARLLIALEGVVPHPSSPSETDASESVWSVLSRPNPSLSSQLRAAQARSLEDGIIGGVAGAMLVDGLRRNLPVAVLLVSAKATEYPDHRAGATLIETLDRMFPELKIDTGPLRSQAEMIERALRAAMKARPGRTPPQGPPETVEPSPEPTIYG